VINDEDFRAEVAKRENPYGDGNSAPKVLEVLKTVDLDDNLIYKNITY
jgi:GDP/UDP-N,N'-diacetylbacillosamine 2-epimerase (hydrolysing)